MRKTVATFSQHALANVVDAIATWIEAVRDMGHLEHVPFLSNRETL